MSKKEGEWQNISSKYVIAGLSALIILLAVLVFFHIPNSKDEDGKDSKNSKESKDSKDTKDDSKAKNAPKLQSSKNKSKKSSD